MANRSVSSRKADLSFAGSMAPDTVQLCGDTYQSKPLLAMVSESRRSQALTPHLGRSLSLASRRNGFFALHPWIQTLPCF